MPCALWDSYRQPWRGPGCDGAVGGFSWLSRCPGGHPTPVPLSVVYVREMQTLQLMARLSVCLKAVSVGCCRDLVSLFQDSVANPRWFPVLYCRRQMLQ